MADDGPCCGFKKKTVVMTCIGLCCLMLVVWTVVITAATPIEAEKENSTATNATGNGTALPMLGVCPLNSSLPLDRVSMALTMPKIGTSPSIKKIKIGQEKTHCKCLCQFNVTESEIIEALREVRKQRQLEKKNKNL